MAGVVSVGIVSTLLTSIDKGIALLLQEADPAETGLITSSGNIRRVASELQSHCDQVKAFLEHDEEPLIVRVNDLARRVWQILSDILAVSSGRDPAKLPLNQQPTPEELRQSQNVEAAVVSLEATKSSSERSYGDTYLADNARAHLGDVVHYHINHYYGTPLHVATDSQQSYQQIYQTIYPVARRLQQEAKECWQVLSARITVVMDGKGLPATAPETEPEIQKKKVTEFANTMKHALWYPELFFRQERIVQAHNKTFQWAFDECDKAHDAKWDCFVCWLKKGSGIYWVNGKAGSGKSTFINYVKDEDRTIRALEEWGPLTDLVVGSFFFWNSGTVLERSLLGLYRSLIIQILDKAPRTVEIMFDKRAIAEAISITQNSDRDTYWTEQKLSNALRRLAAASTRYETFCLFVDGLDEFDGDHDILVEILEEISSSKHIKICCSSRPLPVFTENFAECSKLRLQDLTANDIRAYVSDELKRSKKGRKFAEDKKSDFDSLVTAVAEKADGVFLWVYLVAKSLQTGLRNGDTKDELEARVDDSPPDLIELFRKMISNLDPRYRAEGASIFRITLSAPTKDQDDKDHTPAISVLDLLMAADDLVVTKAQAKFFPRTKPPKLAEQVQNFEQRVAVTCCGLLEFSATSEDAERDWLVDVKSEITPIIRVKPRLLHQSVSEFLKEQDTMADFRIEPTFEDYEKLLAGRVMVIKSILRSDMTSKAIHDLADYAFAMAKHIQEKTGRTNTVLVEEIYASCSACAKIPLDRKNWLCLDNRTSQKIIRWTREVDLSYNTDIGQKDIEVIDDFDLLAYAIAFGLYSYAYDKISEDPGLIRKRGSIPLLHVMMLQDAWYLDKSHHVSRVWLDLLRKLLEAGADPNFNYRGQTPWSFRLSMLAREIRWSSLGAIPEELHTLLEFGADVNVRLRYTGVIGPLARVEGYATSYDHFDSDDDDILGEATDKQLVIVNKPQQDNSELRQLELHQLLQKALDDNTRSVKLRQNNRDEEDEKLSFADILESNDELIIFMFGKVVAAQKENIRRATDYGDSGWTASDEAAIHVFPAWEISLLQWVNECLIQTEAVKTFGRTLTEKGAVTHDPKLVFIFAQKGSLADIESKDEIMEKLDGEDSSDFDVVVMALDAEQSVTMTAAWKKAFPDYITGGLTRELHRMLSLVNERIDAPLTLGARGSMPVDMTVAGFKQLIADAKVPTTGLRVCGMKLDPMTEACGRLLGSIEIMLKWGNQFDELGGLAGLMEFRGPEELQEDAFWGESQACSVM